MNVVVVIGIGMERNVVIVIGMERNDEHRKLLPNSFFNLILRQESLPNQYQNLETYQLGDSFVSTCDHSNELA